MKVQITSDYYTGRVERIQIISALTKLDMRILKLLACGFRQIEVARALNVNRKTVRRHTEKILCHLGARNTPHAIYLASKKYSGVIGQ